MARAPLPRTPSSALLWPLFRGGEGKGRQSLRSGGRRKKDPTPSCPCFPVLHQLRLPPNSAAPPISSAPVPSSPVASPLSPPHAPPGPNAFSSPAEQTPRTLDLHSVLTLSEERSWNTLCHHDPASAPTGNCIVEGEILWSLQYAWETQVFMLKTSQRH